MPKISHMKLLWNLLIMLLLRENNDLWCLVDPKTKKVVRKWQIGLFKVMLQGLHDVMNPFCPKHQNPLFFQEHVYKIS